MYRTAALPVLAGLADVEGISHTAPNARGSLCIINTKVKLYIIIYDNNSPPGQVVQFIAYIYQDNSDNILDKKDKLDKILKKGHVEQH